jgi:hypothetical protein
MKEMYGLLNNRVMEGKMSKISYQFSDIPTSKKKLRCIPDKLSISIKEDLY